MCSRDRVRPGISEHGDFPLESRKAALLVNDIQKYLVSTDKASYLATIAAPRTIANIAKLTKAFRKIRDRECNEVEEYNTLGCEVIFIYLQCLTKDGRDISLDYKLSGPLLNNIPRYGTKPEDIFLPECYPDIPTIDEDGIYDEDGELKSNNSGSMSKGDILIGKTSCSVFRSTNLDYVLRNLGIEQVVIVGQLTDQCLLSAVRDAADFNYFVTIVEDACCAETEEDHQRGLACMKGFCRIVSTDQILAELRTIERKLNSEEQIFDSQQKSKRARSEATSASKHELVTLPKKTKFKGIEIVESVAMYPQAKCSGCAKRVRTYCRCTPGTIRCQECYGKHLVEIESSVVRKHYTITSNFEAQL